MPKSKVHFKSYRHFEAAVIQAALLLLNHYKLPAERDDANLYREHPKHWPMPERSLRQPSGKRGKGFDGLTYGPREFLKTARIEGPAELLFGLKVLAWWHRDLWNGLRGTNYMSYADYMRFMLENGEGAADLPKRELVMLRRLYGIAVEPGQLEDRKVVA